MKQSLAIAAIVLAGCANMIRPTHVTEDEISFRYDTLANSWEAVTERASAHCAQTDRQAEVVSRWDNIGTRGATFRCVDS